MSVLAFFGLAGGILTQTAIAGEPQARMLRRAIVAVDRPVLGTALDETSLKGKPLLVTFYASWCPPCTLEFHELNRVVEQIGADRIAVVAINVHEDVFADKNGRMARFLKRTAPLFTVLGPTPAAVEAVGGVPRIPTVYLFDGKDREAYRFVHREGAEKTNTTAEEILAALAQIGIARSASLLQRL